MANPIISFKPGAYKANKAYSILPEDGSADFVAPSRSTVADRVAPNGEYERVAVDTPRVDYSEPGCPALMQEKGSTNLMVYSEDFSQWSQVVAGTGSMSVDSAYAPGPYGSEFRATRVDVDMTGGEGSTSNYAALGKTYAQSSGNDYTMSAWIKSLDGEQEIVFDNRSQWYNSTTITEEWQRVTWTRNSTDTSSTRSVYIGLRGGSYHTGKSTASFLIWGVQVEQGTKASTYIKTDSATVSRYNEDQFTSGTISKKNRKGTFSFDIAGLDNGGETRAITYKARYANTGVEMLYSSTENLIRLAYYYNGTQMLSTYYTSSTDHTVRTKFDVSYGDDGLTVRHDGIIAFEDTTPIEFSADLDYIIARNITSGNIFFGKIYGVDVYEEENVGKVEANDFDSLVPSKFNIR